MKPNITSAELDNQILAFKQAGGVIQQIPDGVSATDLKTLSMKELMAAERQQALATKGVPA
jgi:hypothetical protein